MSIILLAGVMGMLAACSGQGTAQDAEKAKPVVLTTFTVLQDMGKEVAGDHLIVESITQPGEEIHDFQPSPDDIRRGADADLILANGLGLERWFERFTANSGAKTVVLSEGVAPIPIAEGEYEGEPNPHAWMSPEAAKTYVDNMVEAFTELDPEHAADFEANGERYKQQLDSISTELKDELARVPEASRALVTCEGAFSYLARDAGLTEQYLWAVNAEGALTPQRIAAVQDFVTRNKVPAVFCESTVEGKMDPIVEATDAKYGGTLYVDSLTEEGGDAPTYLDLLRYDARTITGALTGDGTKK
ncbi:metal ABC transporter substrate-binding protein [Actinobaculum sp. 352]|nr:metal ABC transporter substrate-binding protein [Actinobaculum sp. 352]